MRPKWLQRLRACVRPDGQWQDLLPLWPPLLAPPASARYTHTLSLTHSVTHSHKHTHTLTHSLAHSLTHSHTGAGLAACHGIVLRSVFELLGAAQRMREAGVARISVSAQYLQVYREAVTCLACGSAVTLRSGTRMCQKGLGFRV